MCFSVFNLTCAADVAWKAPRVSCSESQLVLAGNVGRKIWADWSASSELESEPVGAAGLVAVLSSCPVAKDEWNWMKDKNTLCHVESVLTCALLVGVTLLHFCRNIHTRVNILPAMSI